MAPMPAPVAWQDIATAPKDGSAVILLCEGIVDLGSFDDGLGSDGVQYDDLCWIWFDQTGTGPFQPTHWQSLPRPERCAESSAPENGGAA